MDKNAIKLVITVAILCMANVSIAAKLTATPDRSVIGEDETLQLTVRVDEQIGFGGPDFSLIEEDFEILNQHRSNQFRSINGRTEGWTEWNLVLAPKKAGKLLIPSLTFEGEVSDAIEVTVNDASTTPSGDVKEIFTEMEISKDSVYVQEQLLVTFRIFSAVQVREIRIADLFDVENANVEAVSETNFRRTINGQPFRAYEIVYAIHPQKSQPIQIPSLTWNLVTAGTPATWFNDPFRSSRGQVRRIRTDSRTIPVKPRPSQYTGVNWMPATDVTLDQHWSSDPSRFVVGEPITRTLTLKAKGLTASQLPAIPHIESDKVKVYSDQPQFDETKSRDGVTGLRIETSAIVPTEAGDFYLPPVRVSWWDTINDREQVTELPAQLINVAPAAVGNIPAQPQIAPPKVEDSDDLSVKEQTPVNWQNITSYWPLLLSNVIFIVLSLAFLSAWISVRQQQRIMGEQKENPEENHTLNQITRQLRIACSENNANLAKQQLGLWGQQFFQLSHVASIQDISQRCRYSPLKSALKKLDEYLYSPRGGESWNGQELWQAISALIKHHRQQSTKKNTQGQLKPLYPTAA